MVKDELRKNEDLIDKEYIKKCEEYTSYIDEHIANVKTAFQNLFRNPDKPFTNFHGITGDKLAKVLDTLEMLVANHDSTKYIDEEFEGYRAHFYPTTKESQRMETDSFYKSLVESNYNLAWFHHLTFNDHHPDFWKWVDIIDMQVPDTSTVREGGPVSMKTVKQRVILKTPKDVANPMKPIAILHMICDWEAMSIKFGSSTSDWYINKAEDERKALNPKTRKIVEELLRQLYDCEIPEACSGEPGYVANSTNAQTEH